MYFPYLKLRQEEARAVRSTICGYADNKVVPILEPYHDKDSEVYRYKNLIDTVNCLISNNKKFILLIENENDLNFLKSKFINFNNFCIRGYKSDNPAVKNYQGSEDIAIIHIDTNIPIPDKNQIKYHIMMPSVLMFTSYLKNYPTTKVVKIEDGFVKHSPNNTYPTSDIFNSESVFTFKQDGYAGFGDFTILEEGYEVATGAKLSNVTYVIHLTRKQDANPKLEVCHYLTSVIDEPDTKRRAKQTLVKAYNERHRFLHTAGIQLIIDKYPSGSSAAFYKRIGMIHHIDLMHSLI